MHPNELNDSPIPYKAEGYPVTPYQKAAQEWDDRIGAARVQAKNWRIMALILAALSAILAAGLVYQSAKSTVIPYVVEVNNDGQVRAVGPAARTNYVPPPAVLHYFLSQFVIYVRSLPLDPVVARNQWLSAYAYLRQSAANTLSEIALREQSLKKVGKEVVSVRIKSIVPLSKESYQVRWEESRFNNDGIASGVKDMTGLFTVELTPPTDEKALKMNPLGLYIKQFNWSQESPEVLR